VKLDFHSKNPFPGNLQVTDAQLEAMAQNNIDAYFQLTVEMFDYMDEILNLQTLIFGSLDMSRANSMTASGQCRLGPLIPCIQDSSHLYDYTVKIMFKLHSSLPPETLSGHRERFRRQFDLLKAFYEKSRDLQYFKNLIQVPGLPSVSVRAIVNSERVY
jgi:huntingtin interacting protein 1